MNRTDRLPAIPLIASDPYISVWSPYDLLTDGDTAHWSGPEKPVRGTLTADGKIYRFLGAGDVEPMKTVSLKVSATATESVFTAGGTELTVIFRTAAFPDDWDLLSEPITAVEFSVRSLDGVKRDVTVGLSFSSRFCYDGDVRPEIISGNFRNAGTDTVWLGQRSQKLLCHSGDHITIDWGYMYLSGNMSLKADEEGLFAEWTAAASSKRRRTHLLFGYDDVASILYFGTPCKSWYARDGKTLPQAMSEYEANYAAIASKCTALDRMLEDKAVKIGGADYAAIVNAAWRHTFAAHKLIATPEKKPALLSKENDSNGCIGTVDVAYPASPIFLAFSPQLVNALCRPVLEYASMPVWDSDFAPHDVGRYPIAGGQVYGLSCRPEYRSNGSVFPPFYHYPAGSNLFSMKYQMPVEECGNMLCMLCAAAEKTGDYSLIVSYRPLLEKWVKYLTEFGEDPGEQLCTDDFAGHLAHNVNLSAKAIVGIALWAKALDAIGADGGELFAKAEKMADSWYGRALTEDATALTFDGVGWSMKYNTVWDKIFGLGLFPDEFYSRETAFYLRHLNKYGLPLDSRADYTKSDWLVWSACLSPDKESFMAEIAPLARFLRESESRVPFSDWYFTSDGRYRAFIGRPVQGGLFIPFLFEKQQ